jgi:hypothetical protein
MIESKKGQSAVEEERLTRISKVAITRKRQEEYD